MVFTILKPSFWKSDREIRDESKILVGKYRATGAWRMKAEGEAEGRKLLLTYTGLDSRYSQMSDATGQVIARIEPTGWWGVAYKLTYKGKEYTWKLNGWGTTFMIYDGENEIVRVYPGGYFRPGSATVLRGMPTQDVVQLVLHGIYQLNLIAAQAAAAGSGT